MAILYLFFSLWNPILLHKIPVILRRRSTLRIPGLSSNYFLVFTSCHFLSHSCASAILKHLTSLFTLDSSYWVTFSLSTMFSAMSMYLLFFPLPGLVAGHETFPDPPAGKDSYLLWMPVTICIYVSYGPCHLLPGALILVTNSHLDIPQGTWPVLFTTES